MEHIQTNERDREQDEVEMTEEQSKPTERNKGGRPRKGDKPLIPYNELDNLLVKGEIVSSKDGRGTKVIYPTFEELSRRFGVSKSTISSFSTKRNCKRRRQELKKGIKVKPEYKLSDYQDQDIDFNRDDVLRIIRKWLMRFEEAVEEGSVRFDNPSDLNTLARLQEFLSGHAESRKEIHSSLTLEEIQERHMAQLKIIENTTPGERGEVVERTIEGTIETTVGNIGTYAICVSGEENAPNEVFESSVFQKFVRFPVRFLCPHCGSEIGFKNCDEMEAQYVDVEAEVIDYDPGQNDADESTVSSDPSSSTPELPLHAKNGNSSSEHDNDYE